MKRQLKDRLHTRIKICMWIMIAGLLASGITAFPIETELTWFINHQPSIDSTLYAWLNKVYAGIIETNIKYPFISYGTDWLAFAHVMLGVLFAGPLINPVRNIWVVQFGIIAALAIFPLAFIAGGIKGFPFFWQCIDCSFGVLTLAVLLPCHKWIKQLEAQG